MDQEREKVTNSSKTYNWLLSFRIVLKLRMSCHYVDKKIDVSFEYVASFLDGGSPNMKYQSTSITEGLLSVRICRELKTMYSHKLLIFKHFLFHTIKGSLAFFCVWRGVILHLEIPCLTFFKFLSPLWIFCINHLTSSSLQVSMMFQYSWLGLKAPHINIV